MPGDPMRQTQIDQAAAPTASWREAPAKIFGLQWGRGLAAVMVVITHAIAHPFPAAPGVVHLFGRFGVTLFFVISGYIMVLTTGTGPFKPLSFMRKRLLRVVPMYYLATAVAIAAVLIAPSAFKDTVFDTRHIIMSLLFIPTLEPGSTTMADPFLRLGWTLNFEMFFYVLFALLFALNAVMRAAVLTLIFGVLITIGFTIAPKTEPLEFYTRIDTLAFVAGVWLAVLARRYHWRPATSVSIVLLGAALVSMIVMGGVYHQVRNNPWTQVWLVANCATIVGVLAVGVRQWEGKAPGWATLLGDASYSMYLFHMFAVGAVTVVAMKLLPRGALYAIMPITALVGILAGVLIYRYVETPLNRLVKRGADGVSAALSPRSRSA